MPPYTAVGLGELEIDGQTLQPSDRPPYFAANSVGVDYFRVMGIPILQGRAFTPEDDHSATSIIINDQMAKR
jgi:hypothetical protein